MASNKRAFPRRLPPLLGAPTGLEIRGEPFPHCNIPAISTLVGSVMKTLRATLVILGALVSLPGQVFAQPRLPEIQIGHSPSEQQVVLAVPHRSDQTDGQSTVLAGPMQLIWFQHSGDDLKRVAARQLDIFGVSELAVSDDGIVAAIPHFFSYVPDGDVLLIVNPNDEVVQGYSVLELTGHEAPPPAHCYDCGPWWWQTPRERMVWKSKDLLKVCSPNGESALININSRQVALDPKGCLWDSTPFADPIPRTIALSAIAGTLFGASLTLVLVRVARRRNASTS